MMNSSIVIPAYYRIFELRDNAWLAKTSEVFYNPSSLPFDANDTEANFGISKRQIVLALHQQFNAQQGYYVADLIQKRYYYCGLVFDDARKMLLSLGVGRLEPEYD
jgi:hypothetical protein